MGRGRKLAHTFSITNSHRQEITDAFHRCRNRNPDNPQSTAFEDLIIRQFYELFGRHPDVPDRNDDPGNQYEYPNEPLTTARYYFSKATALEFVQSFTSRKPRRQLTA